MTNARKQTTTGAGGDLPKAVAPSTGVGGYLSRAMSWRPSALLRGPAASQAGAAGEKPKRSEWNRFFLAMLAYLIGSIAIEYLLLAANSAFNLHLEKTQNLVPTSWPLIGSMSKYSLLYLMLLVALIWLLYRTRIMPRDLFGARAAQQRRAGGGNAASSTTEASSASRRHSARKLTALVSTTPVPRRKKSGRQSTTAAPARATAATATTSAGNHDDEYERARAIQRSRRRKH